MSALEETIKQLLIDGKGILAADESNQTASKRLKAAGVEATAENRRRYRQLLFTTPGLADYLSGVILYDETIRQQDDNGTALPALLLEQGIVPGIKTDAGLVSLPNAESEQVSTGLDGLAARYQEYRQFRAGFAKWRSVFQVGDATPSDYAIAANADVLARYAKTTQEAGLVPIVEPEVLLDGDHTIEQCEAASQRVLNKVFKVLAEQEVDLKTMLLKASMVLPGSRSTQYTTSVQVADATVRTLTECVPKQVPGIVFMSGGQSPAQATENLNEIAKLKNKSWYMSFSFSRALQDPVLTYWAGKDENAARAQELFAERLKLAALAQAGQYSPDLEPDYSHIETSISQD